MRLLLVTAAYPFGPYEVFLDPEVLGLRHCGHDLYISPTRLKGRFNLDASLTGEVTVLALPGMGPATLASLLRWGVEHPVRLAVWIRRLFESGAWRGFKNLAVLPKAVRLGLWAKSHGIEHIHSHWGGTSSSMAMVAADVAELGWSLTCHSWDIEENNLLRTKGHSASFIRFISARGLRLGTGLGVPAHKTHVIRMGTALASLGTQVSWNGTGTFRIACPASLVAVKGHTYLIEALKLLQARGIDCQLTCFGVGPLRPSLERQCQAQGLQDSIQFVGQIPRDSLLKQLASRTFHLVCLPSIVDDEGFSEGVPVALIEAMGLAIPVVSTRTGSIPELLPDALGLTVPQRDPAALAEAIGRLAQSPERYRAAASTVAAIVQDGWTSQAAVAKLDHLLKMAIVKPEERTA